MSGHQVITQCRHHIRGYIWVSLAGKRDTNESIATIKPIDAVLYICFNPMVNRLFTSQVISGTANLVEVDCYEWQADE